MSGVHGARMHGVCLWSLARLRSSECSCMCDRLKRRAHKRCYLQASGSVCSHASQELTVKWLCLSLSAVLSIMVWFHFVLRFKRQHLESKTWRDPYPRGHELLRKVLQKFWKHLLIECCVCLVHPPPFVTDHALELEGFSFEEERPLHAFARLESLLVLASFLKMYLVWRLFVMWTFSHYMSENFLRYMQVYVYVYVYVNVYVYTY